MNIMTEYRSAIRKLRSATKTSKANCWRDLWGLGHKLVTRKFRALRNPYSFKPEQMNHIVRALFPPHPMWVDNSVQCAVDWTLSFTKLLEHAVLFMKNEPVLQHGSDLPNPLPEGGSFSFRMVSGEVKIEAILSCCLYTDHFVCLTWSGKCTKNISELGSLNNTCFLRLIPVVLWF